MVAGLINKVATTIIKRVAITAIDHSETAPEGAKIKGQKYQPKLMRNGI